MTYNIDLDSLTGDILLNDIPASSNIVEMIETVIFSLSEENSGKVKRNEAGFLWTFKYGTVDVFVQLTGTTDEDTFTVWSSVLKLPASKEAELMRHLLELNWTDTFESCFCILGDEIVVSTKRTVAELSPGEISRNITIVATIADEQDEKLLQEYGVA